MAVDCEVVEVVVDIAVVGFVGVDIVVVGVVVDVVVVVLLLYML